MGQLRDRMEADLRLTGYSPSTRKIYLGTITLKRETEVEHLPVRRKKVKLPVVLSGTEVEALLDAVRSPKYRAIVMAQYAGGLRISEACRLRPEDIDSERMVIHVRAGKGGRDRYTVLSARFLAFLRDYFRKCSTTELSNPEAWRRFKDGLYEKDWVVFAKPPFGGAEQVFNYLGRYTHRIAISNHRIVDFADGKVTFSWKDYADDCKKKLMTLDAAEFLRRFLLHVLPSGFVRIRHYGLCASSNVNTKLVTARRLLEPHAEPPKSDPAEPKPRWERFLEQTGIDVMACPSCQAGRMHRQRSLSPVEIILLTERIATPKVDTS